MDAEERKALEERSQALRLELKTWEKDFAARNEGRKASNKDIKKNPEIASRYKEYDRTRNIISGKVALKKEPPIPGSTPRKRKHDDEHGQVFTKRQQIDKTPSKNSILPWEVDPYFSPSIMRNLFTPSKKTAIGPTPQKDGQVLGLFDLEEDTPSKGLNTEPPISSQATPRRQKDTEDLKALVHSRTPASSGKRYMLNAFATPSKNRNLNGQGEKTPSSVSRLHFATPSFLRRDSQRIHMPVIDENDQGLPLSPQMIRVPRKPLVRGLSSMLAGLRKMEEDAADEDLEALREMEEEMANGLKTAPKLKASKTAPKSPPYLPAANEDVLVEDSQPKLLGGFDDETKYDTDPEETQNPPVGRSGLAQKTYKKKGQKRTTRRVNMRPTRFKPALEPPTPHPEESEDELSQIPGTQLQGSDKPKKLPEYVGLEGRNFESDSQSEYTASEGGTRYRRPDQGKGKKNKEINNEGRVKSAARKVKATANQNFKRLKLRNSGAKGGPGVGSRFRRRK